MNGFQFSYGIPADAIQVVVQAFASANAATYDDTIWEKYKLGERLGVNDPETGEPALRNIWYASSVRRDRRTARLRKTAATLTMRTPASRGCSGVGLLVLT